MNVGQVTYNQDTATSRVQALTEEELVWGQQVGVVIEAMGKLKAKGTDVASRAT